MQLYRPMSLSLEGTKTILSEENASPVIWRVSVYLPMLPNNACASCVVLASHMACYSPYMDSHNNSSVRAFYRQGQTQPCCLHLADEPTHLNLSRHICSEDIAENGITNRKSANMKSSKTRRHFPVAKSVCMFHKSALAAFQTAKPNQMKSPYMHIHQQPL